MRNKIIAILIIIVIAFEFFVPTPFIVPKSVATGAAGAAVDAVKGENVRDIEIRRQKNGNDNINSLINEGTTTSKTGTTDGNKRVDQTDEITSSPTLFSGAFAILRSLLSIVPAMISTLLTLTITGKPFVPIVKDNTNVFTVGGVLSNQYSIFDIDLFDTKKTDETHSEITSLIRTQIATWYMTIRNLSIMLLVVVLMYIAIRMLIGTSSPSETAKLKNMLIGWIRGTILVFILQYLVIAIIALSNLAIKIISDLAAETLVDVEKKIMQNIFGTYFFEGSIIKQLFYFLAMVSIIWYQLKFCIVYAKRAMQVYVLIIISPLICVSYPIDRISDDRGQALRQWIIDFSTAVLMQPFQYMIYVLIFGSFDEIMLKVPLLTAIAFYLLGKSIKVAKKALQIKSNKEIDKDLDEVLKVGK